MNGIELSLPGQRLVQIAQEALPPDSAARRLPPAARLVLGDVMQHSGTSTGQVAERTGLAADQVAALVSDLARDELVRDGLDSDGRQRISVNPAPAFRDAPRSTRPSPPRSPPRIARRSRRSSRSWSRSPGG